jgi:alpha-D-ribose 1-methylphosphonate 5-triphosphate diphosphatase
MPHERCLTNARIITADFVTSGYLHIRDGLIRDIAEKTLPALHKKNGCPVEDCQGDYLLPGLVELHTDNLEKHLMPRPSVIWPSAESAFLAHDAQVAAAGITTVFDSICIGETQDKGRYPMLKLGFDAFHTCAGWDDLRVDHYLHLRCEVNDPNMWNMFEPLSQTRSLQLVSLMDHTPGQRQWRNTDAYRTYYSKSKVWNEEEFAASVAELQDRQKVYAPLHTRMVMNFCREHNLPMASHDDTTIEQVDEALRNGISISEFPTTLEAARHAARNGMTVLMGSPNVVRGKSHSGNISALEVAQHGYLGGLSSDYVPASLLHSAFILHKGAGLTLPEAVRRVSLCPAKAVGLTDRGEIKPGLRADMVRVTMRDALPVVRKVWNQGKEVF